jgi:hypothetical protein
MELEEIVLACLAKSPADRVDVGEEWTAARARLWWEENRPGVSLPEAALARR